jgi:Protein of unknown function (DUF2550)
MAAVAFSAGILLLLGCLCLGYLAFRRVRLMRGGGVDVCLRRQGPGRRPARVSRDAAAGWHFGVGRYQGNEFVWHRLTSLRPVATTVLDRTGLEIVERRDPVAGEVYALPQAASVLRCRVGDREIELAMTPGVLTGFLSWLESAPPGPAGYRVAS